MTKEIRPNYGGGNVGVISFRYMRSGDIHKHEHDPIRIFMYSLIGFNKIEPGYAGSNFSMGKSQIIVNMDDKEAAFDNEKVALVWDQYAGNYEVVDIGFIRDIYKYAFLLEDKFFDSREEADNYFRSFIVGCYSAWINSRKNGLGVTE